MIINSTASSLENENCLFVIIIVVVVCLCSNKPSKPRRINRFFFELTFQPNVGAITRIFVRYRGILYVTNDCKVALHFIHINTH